MIKILYLFVFFISCNKDFNYFDKNEKSIIKGNEVYYGFYLKSLQLNEDGTYRISFFNKEKIEVFISVQQKKVIIENNKNESIVYMGFDNGNPNGNFIIYLKPNFKITKYYN